MGSSIVIKRMIRQPAKPQATSKFSERRKRTRRGIMCVSDLKKIREWTDALIKRFLGQPDRIKTNPYFPCKSPMKLYALKRVRTIEATDDFKEAAKACVERSLLAWYRANKAIDTKRKNLLEEIETVFIELRDVSRETLIDHTDFFYTMEYFMAVGLWKDRSYVPRITNLGTRYSDQCCEAIMRRNDLRRMCSNYDSVAASTKGKVGRNEAIRRLRNRIDDVIAQRYPWLKPHVTVGVNKK